MKHKKHVWFKLDNAGKLYPSIASTRVSTLFRVSATLTEVVDETLLQRAVNNLMPRFPYFQVNLKKGVFWYYFDKTNNYPLVEKETFYPCMNLEIKKKNCFPFRILYYNKKISVEFSHSITDGTGGTVFLKSLLVEYFSLKGIPSSKLDGIFYKDEMPDDLEYEDSFSKYYKKVYPDSPKKAKAFHFPFKLDNKGVYHIVTGVIPIKTMLNKSKEFNVTLTEFLCAVYLESILDLIYKYNKKSYLKPIVLNVPVSLRGIYDSKTMRNFFMSVTPEIDPRLGDYSFEEILKYVHNYMKLVVNKKYMNKLIKGTVKNEKSFIVKIIPRVLKDLMLPLFYKRRGESCYTSSISNMGKIKMPPELDQFIERFEAYPPPSAGNIIKIVTLSYKDNLYLSFGKLTTNTEIETIFFRKLRKMGIPIKIETN